MSRPDDSSGPRRPVLRRKPLLPEPDVPEPEDWRLGLKDDLEALVYKWGI
jgi:hypothetical protein